MGIGLGIGLMLLKGLGEGSETLEKSSVTLRRRWSSDFVEFRLLSAKPETTVQCENETDTKWSFRGIEMKGRS